MNMIPHKTIERLAAMAMDVQVNAAGTGALTLSIPGHGRQAIKLFQIEPLLFRTDSGGYVAFREDAKGRIINMFLSGLVGNNLFDPTSFDKLHWYESGKLHAGLAAVGFLVFLLFPFITLGMYIFGRWRQRSQSAPQLTRLARIAWRLAVVVSVLVILSPVSGIIMAFLTKEHQLYSIPPILYVALSFLLLASIFGLALPVFVVFAWRHRYWSLGARLLFSLVALAAFCMMPFMNYWNVLGFCF
jgi:hypothetical protein